MRIVELGYSRTQDLGAGDSITLSARSVLDDDEERMEALDELTSWVEDQITASADMALQRRRRDRWEPR